MTTVITHFQSAEGTRPGNVTKKKSYKQLIFSPEVRTHILESHPFFYINIPDNIDLSAFLDMLFHKIAIPLCENCTPYF